MLCLLICALFNTPIKCQTLEKENTQELSKDARKGELFNFNYNEGDKEFTLVFKREKKKKSIYEIYQFDYDLNLLKNETLEESAAQLRYPSATVIETAPTDPWNDRPDYPAAGETNSRMGHPG